MRENRNVTKDNSNWVHKYTLKRETSRAHCLTMKNISYDYLHYSFSSLTLHLLLFHHQTPISFLITEFIHLHWQSLKKNSCIKRLKHRWNDKKWLPYRHFYPNFLAIELIFHKKIPSKLISRPVNTQKHQGKNVIFVTINVIFPH